MTQKEKMGRRGHHFPTAAFQIEQTAKRRSGLGTTI